MPKRSNEFQSIVHDLYRQIAPLGAKVEESVELPERFGGAKREVDILISHDLCGIEFKLAIECRDRTRLDTIEWIDNLIGKYSNLEVDKIVAISDSGFTDAAKEKAAAKNIRLITAEDAKEVSWAMEILPASFHGMNIKPSLLKITTTKPNGEILTETRRPRNGGYERHLNKLSEKLYPFLLAKFKETAQKKIDQILNREWWRFTREASPICIDVEYKDALIVRQKFYAPAKYTIRYHTEIAYTTTDFEFPIKVIDDSVITSFNLPHRPEVRVTAVGKRGSDQLQLTITGASENEGGIILEKDGSIRIVKNSTR